MRSLRVKPKSAFSELLTLPPIEAAVAAAEVVSAGLALQRRDYFTTGVSFGGVAISFRNNHGDVS